MDPHSATPLLTMSVFDDYAESKDVALVRCDVLNKSIGEDEGARVMEQLLHHYVDEYEVVETFNQQPDAFDFDDYIARMSRRWKGDEQQ